MVLYLHHFLRHLCFLLDLEIQLIQLILLVLENQLDLVIQLTQ